MVIGIRPFRFLITQVLKEFLTKNTIILERFGKLSNIERIAVKN